MSRKIRPLYIICAAALLFGSIIPIQKTTAGTCPDLRIVFARGSGGTWNEDPNYLTFKSTIEEKLKTTSLDYEFIDLPYTAVAVGMENFFVTLGALVSSGDAYTFGESVDDGVNKLAALVNSNSCPNTKYAIGGYSQGAMVVSKSLHHLDADKVIYAATFGDPKIYLPEGKGLFPDACKNKNLSDYRAYVSDCRTYEGLLGSYRPYQPEGFIGKLGTWCNKMDVFCSTYFSLDDHLAYISDDLYEDASKVFYDKITKHFGVENTITSPHDTAILIDSTGSMSPFINQYKTEALRLATETLNSGGRVALFDYRDLNDPYEPKEHCNFETCTLDIFQQELNKITTDGGGDTPESLLSASLRVMKKLNWKYGATKSLIILTDAGFHSPDLDSTTIEDVVNLSRSIDPVNFYIITTPENKSDYELITTETDGKVVTELETLNLLTDYIMERYDSLPKVEAMNPEVPESTLEIKSANQISDTEFQISFITDADQVLVILNDLLLGLTTEKTITLTELDFSTENTIKLIPIKDGVKGKNQIITAPIVSPTTPLIPKAPNTGIL